MITAVLALMVAGNVETAFNDYRYDLTYTEAVEYIESEIPAGASIYCTSFAPGIDEERYTVFYSVFAENLMPDITVLENKT